MESPADRQVEANETVDWIARELFVALAGTEEARGHWSLVEERDKEGYRLGIRILLERGVIKPGKRERSDPPMVGQATFDDLAEQPPA
jgi:hypothetical protein